MVTKFDYQFTCEKCGGTFYSKVDTSTWRHHICNKCSGKPYKDYPVENTQQQYATRPVPTKPVYNNIVSPKIEVKEFNLADYISDMLVVYVTLRDECDKAGLTIPQDSLCSWTTSIMIQKGKLRIGD